MFHVKWDIWLIKAVNFVILYSPEAMSNNILNYLFNIVLYHNCFAF